MLQQRRMSSKKFPHESRLHLSLRHRRSNQVDKLATAKTPVHAQHEETPVLSAHVGGETLQRVVDPQNAGRLEEVSYDQYKWEGPVRFVAVAARGSSVEVHGDPVATELGVDVTVFVTRPGRG
jgi:creatinine amidohydrolase/Fe(II)-dependent formamide hydrolase-like protein